MKTKLFALLLALLPVFCLSSCLGNDDDDKKAIEVTARQVAISPDGGEYTVTCLNYNAWTMLAVCYMENGESEVKYVEASDTATETNVNYEWMHLEIPTIQRNTLHIQLDPNNTGYQRQLEVALTANSMLTTVLVTQESNPVTEE